MDTISLSRTVLKIMPVKILKAEQNDGFWPFKEFFSDFFNIFDLTQHTHTHTAKVNFILFWGF